MRRVVLVPQARRDLSGIWDFSAEAWGAAQADRYVARLVSRMEQAARRQSIGRPSDDLYPGLRRPKSGSHFIYFLEADDGIRVVRILHEQMDVEQHLTALADKPIKPDEID